MYSCSKVATHYATLQPKGQHVAVLQISPSPRATRSSRGSAAQRTRTAAVRDLVKGLALPEAAPARSLACMTGRISAQGPELIEMTYLQTSK